MRLFILLLAAVFFLASASPAAAAPVERTVADRFSVTVGHQTEPAILGDTNALRVEIRENDQPVTGLAGTITAEVEYMEAVRVLNMLESSTEPGVYVGTFIPMQTGDFTYRIHGTIDGVEINETFGVGDGISPVLPRTDFEFPNAAHGFGPATLAFPMAGLALFGAAAYVWSKRSAR